MRAARGDSVAEPYLAGVHRQSDLTGAIQPAVTYNPHGLPTSIAGEPVVRGPAIGRRMRSGDPAPFLVVGWVWVYADCAPFPTACEFAELSDGPSR